MSVANTAPGTADPRVHIPPSGGRLVLWQKGQSGNPLGVNNQHYNEVKSICAKASPDAAREQVKLMSDPDPRIRFMATEAVLNRGVGKPREQGSAPVTRVDLSALAPAEMTLLADLLRKCLGIDSGNNGR